MIIPSTGISWYEAAAYAEFAGKSLPTIYHWNRAAGPLSGLADRAGKQLWQHGSPARRQQTGYGPVGRLRHGGKCEGVDLDGSGIAANATFWAAHGTSPTTCSSIPMRSRRFLRAADIGFRCVKYIEPDSIPKEAFAAMPSPRRDLTKQKPVSDEIFAAYKGLYSYDKTPLNATVETVDSKDEDWTIQKITYSAAYGHEQAISYSVPAQEGQAALPGRAVLPWIGRAEPAPLYCANRPLLWMPFFAVDAPFSIRCTRALTSAAMAWNRM